ncbi:hypothetical protein JCM14076_17350 [Methylosoma difficile]
MMISPRKTISTKREGNCFVAGTLVHTQAGLKPIEQIQVGDYVLSKPESGDGELSYQRVTRTYEYEDREVYFLAFHPVNPDGLRGPERDYVVVTGAHPLWIKSFSTLQEHGDRVDWVHTPVNAWMSVEALYTLMREYDADGGKSIVFSGLISDGRDAKIHEIGPIARDLENPDYGTVKIAHWRWDGAGPAVRFGAAGPEATIREGQVIYDYAFGLIDRDYDLMESMLDWPEHSLAYQLFHPMRRKVYNIEVEYTHTYFVGTQGVWVYQYIQNAHVEIEEDDSFANLWQYAYDLARDKLWNKSLTYFDRAINAADASSDDIATATKDKAVTLAFMGRTAEALALFGEVIERYQYFRTTAARQAVDKAYYNKAGIAEQAGDEDEALIQLDHVITRNPNCSDLKTDQLVIACLTRKANILLKNKNQFSDAIATLDLIVEQFASSDNPEIAVSVINTLMRKVLEIVMKDQTENWKVPDEDQSLVFSTLDNAIAISARHHDSVVLHSGCRAIRLKANLLDTLNRIAERDLSDTWLNRIFGPDRGWTAKNMLALESNLQKLANFVNVSNFT